MTKRGSYTKHKKRKYPSQSKTTTPQGLREYQRHLMRIRRGTPPNRFYKPGRPPTRVLLKDLAKDLEKLKKKVTK